MNKKILITILSISAISTALAANQYVEFNSIEQAQKYCPPEKGLIFTKNNPAIPNSSGTISGNNRIVFESIPPKIAIYPKNIGANGFISDAEFRSTNKIYGYIANNVVTCLYSYTSFLNTQYALVLRGK